MLEKWISILLVPLLFLQTLVPALLGNRNAQSMSDADLKTLHSLQDYVTYIDDHGAPSYATETFVRQGKPLGDLLRVLSGRPFPKDDERYLNVQLDDTLQALCAYIEENSGLDVAMLIGTVPNLNAPAELAVKTLHLDTAALREQLFALRDKAYDSNQTLLGYLLYLMGVYFSIIREVDVYTVPAENSPDELQVMMDICYDDGEKAVMSPGLFINQTTGQVRGNTDKGLIDLGFDFSIEDLVIYGAVHCWQRALGFDRLYDLLANSTFLFNMSTRRFHFNAHGKEWMIQLWKGNYGLVTNGVEVGVYNRKPGSIGTFYSAAGDDELMEMSASLYHGDKLLFSRGPVMHWWLSAFQLSKVIYQPKDLTMTFSITFPDEELFRAFTAALDSHGAHDVSYTTDGLTVNGRF